MIFGGDQLSYQIVDRALWVWPRKTKNPGAWFLGLVAENSLLQAPFEQFWRKRPLVSLDLQNVHVSLEHSEFYSGAQKTIFAQLWGGLRP